MCAKGLLICAIVDFRGLVNPYKQIKMLQNPGKTIRSPAALVTIEDYSRTAESFKACSQSRVPNSKANGPNELPRFV